MRSKLFLGAVMAAIFTAGAAAAPLESAKPVDDACSVLTPMQVGAALGFEVGSGVSTGVDKKQSCRWVTPDGNRYVTLQLGDQDLYQRYKDIKLKTVVITPVSGFGDEAFWVTVSKNTALNVKKANVSFQVAVFGLVPFDQKQAIEKVLAPQVLDKLPASAQGTGR